MVGAGKGWTPGLLGSLGKSGAWGEVKVLRQLGYLGTECGLRVWAWTPGSPEPCPALLWAVAQVEQAVLVRAYTALAGQLERTLRARLGYVMLEQLLLKYVWSAAGLLMVGLPLLRGPPMPFHGEHWEGLHGNWKGLGGGQGVLGGHWEGGRLLGRAGKKVWGGAGRAKWKLGATGRLSGGTFGGVEKY